MYYCEECQTPTNYPVRLKVKIAPDVYDDYDIVYLCMACAYFNHNILFTSCKYPDWEGGYYYGRHTPDKDGFCSICGTKVF